jgi:predicted HTH domain antitoxin
MAMHTLTTDDLQRRPLQLVEDAQRGEPANVTRDGQPVLLSVPLGQGIESAAVRVELAATLFDREQISLGLAARIAGLSYGQMVDELGRRSIPVIRLAPGELDRELEAFGH